MGSLGQQEYARCRMQTIVQVSEVTLAGFDKALQLFQLRHTDRGLHVANLEVVTKMRVCVLMIVSVRQAPQLPVKSLSASIVLPWRTPAVTTPIAKRLYEFGKLRSIGCDTTTFAHCNVVRGIETEGRQISECS